MKKKHIISWSVLGLIALALAACGIFGQEIIFSDNPTANKEITMTTRYLIQNTTGMGKPGENSPDYLLYAVLVPSVWEDFEDNAVVTCSSKNISVESYGGPDFTNETCHAIPGTTIPNAEFAGATLSEWYAAKIGFAENKYGSMTWHFYKSDKPGYLAQDLDAELTVTIKFKAGPQNFDFNICNGIMTYNNGPHTWWYNGPWTGAEIYKELVITGGDAYLDYVHQPVVSTVPMNVRYGDVFSVNYVSELSGVPSPLKGEKEVYLTLIAELSNGSTKECKVHSSKTLMKMTDDISYYKYVYPKDLLGLKQSDEIKSLYVNFENADGSKKDCHETLPGYPINQSNKKK